MRIRRTPSTRRHCTKSGRFWPGPDTKHLDPSRGPGVSRFLKEAEEIVPESRGKWFIIEETAPTPRSSHPPSQPARFRAFGMWTAHRFSPRASRVRPTPSTGTRHSRPTWQASKSPRTAVPFPSTSSQTPRKRTPLPRTRLALRPRPHHQPAPSPGNLPHHPRQLPHPCLLPQPNHHLKAKSQTLTHRQ